MKLFEWLRKILSKKPKEIHIHIDELYTEQKDEEEPKETEEEEFEEVQFVEETDKEGEEDGNIGLHEEEST